MFPTCFFFSQNWRIFVSLSLLVTVCNAYKVLVLGPMNGKSHFLYISTFVRVLLDRGHEVTYLTSNSLSKLNLANYTEVLIDPPLDLMKESMCDKDKFIHFAISLFDSYNRTHSISNFCNSRLFHCVFGSLSIRLQVTSLYV